MSIFNWDYFSFVNTDWTWAKRELIAIPVLVLVLCFGWMKMVRVALVDEQEHLISLNKDQPLSDDEGAQSSQMSESGSSSDEDDDDDKKNAGKKSDLNDDDDDEDKKNI